MNKRIPHSPKAILLFLLVGMASSAHAQSLPGCLMSLAAPGTCLVDSIQCRDTQDSSAASYGSAIAALCAATKAQELQAQSLLSACISEKNAQADAFQAQLTQQEAQRIDNLKALARADQKIRTLTRQLRAARRSS